jgi:hypothetical protein
MWVAVFAECAVDATKPVDAAREEDLRRPVDPDLLDGRIVEILLQRAESGDGVSHMRPTQR